MNILTKVLQFTYGFLLAYVGWKLRREERINADDQL